MPRDSQISDFVPLLQELNRAKKGTYFLEGGQAVNFWAEYVSAIDAAEKLRPFLPFTSDDCDIWVSQAAARYLDLRKEGKLVKGTSPADGQLGIFRIPGMPPKKVDLMTGVYGIPPREVKNLMTRALTINDVTVIDPLNLFRCKCHCLVGLDQTGRQDEKHLRMLCLILPAYISHLITETKNGSMTERFLIKEIKMLKKICQMSICRRALAKIEIPPQSLNSVSEMKLSGLPLLVSYAESLK